MSDMPMEELKAKVLEYFKAKGKMMTSRDVAKGLELENRLVKLVLTELVNEGTLEFTSYGGATFIKLPEN
ncbi:MAG TPA: dissimilatory sulfite reductase D family protein [Anaerolineales bacterium]|nr:dissimilatory sulfite reductase D family protein [Anaerolineales bacterium]